MIRASLAALALLPSIATLASEPPPGDVILRHEFFCERETRPGTGQPTVLSLDDMGRRLTAEATWVYMGMIYGFTVGYAPLDRARGVEESFTAEPAWDVKAIRPGLSFGEHRYEGTTLVIYAEYRLDDAEAARYAAWRGTGVPYQASGGASEAEGMDARYEAMEMSIRAALRDYARAVEYNKPKLVRAIAAFESPPVIDIQAGRYVARARVRLKILEIVRYPGM